MGYINTQPEEMTFAKLGRDLSKQEHVFLQLSPTKSQARPPHGARTCPGAPLKPDPRLGGGHG